MDKISNLIKQNLNEWIVFDSFMTHLLNKF